MKLNKRIVPQVRDTYRAVVVLWIIAGLSSAEIKVRASSSSLYGAVILSSQWSSAAVPRSRDARIPPTRADRRSAGILRAVLRRRGAMQCDQSPHRGSDHLS